MYKVTPLLAFVASLTVGLVQLPATVFTIHLQNNGTLGLDITGTVNTTTDSFTINTWTSNPLSSPWTPASSALPLTLQAYTLAGIGTSVAYDVADNWDGTMSGWAFLLPEGTGVEDILWNQGAASIALSSFGWGGFRGNNGYTANIATGVNSLQYVPMSNGALDINLTSVEITAAATPDSGATLGLLAIALGGLVALRRRLA